MALPAVRPQPRALTAAGVRIERDRNGNRPTSTRAENWQREALDLYDNVGAIRYSAFFYSRMLTRLKIFPARLDNQGKPVPITSGLPFDLLNRIQDPAGGRTGLLSDYGRLIFITGECYLFGRNDEGFERWSFVWKDELRFDSTGRVTHVLSPASATKEYDQIADNDFEELGDEQAVAYRFWMPHPRYSQWPDSPLRSVILDGKELMLLGSSVMATATARQVKAPLFVIPQEMAPPQTKPLGTEDPKNNPFLRDLGEHLSAAIKDPTSAAALAPFLVWGSYEFLDRLRPIWLHNLESDYLEKDLREEAVKRLAVGLDFPIEELTGMSDANHWGAWQISEDRWASHGAPIAEKFCDDLGESFLRPALRQAEEEGEFEGWQEVVVAYDASEIIVKPDRSKDAIEVRKLGGINLKALRTATDFSEDDAMTDEEYDEWLIWATKGAVGGDTGDGNNNGPESTEGPPPGQPGPVSEKTNLPNENQMRILAAAELALLRCREQAGVRIRRRKATCPDCLKRVESVAHYNVAAALGAEGLAEFGNLEPMDLVAGGADVLRHLLVNWGYPDSYAERLAHSVELFAGRTLLFDRPPPIPSSLVSARELAKGV